MARWQGTTRAMAKTAARGYGGPHVKLRDQWKPLVDSGQASCHAAICLMPSRRIQPGTPWDLGHTPDRTTWTGPEHQRCNRADGNRRRTGQKTQASRRAPPCICKTCGKGYWHAARACEICGAHYHPTTSSVNIRTCGRTCGLELRRRNGWMRNGSTRMPPPDILPMIKAHARRVREAPLRTSRQW